mmetsp:Transcript_28241/g.68647  ORF Transcript_28241/g.68647 Transcript_28241/m.68647 type:complete len:202 (+) Transcript_28241:160-765(+)
MGLLASLWHSGLSRPVATRAAARSGSSCGYGSCRVSISHTSTPNIHTSLFVVNFCLRSDSGARYFNAPVAVRGVAASLSRMRARPKSAILTTNDELMSTLRHARSRCNTLCSCKNTMPVVMPRSTCIMNSPVSSACLSASYSMSSSVPLRWYSVMSQNWCGERACCCASAFLSGTTTPTNCTTFGWLGRRDMSLASAMSVW